MKKFFKEFKKFITRGNVVDLAIAVIIGGAFNAIVTALTNKIIMPIVNFFLSFGATDGLESAYTFLKKVKVDGVVDLSASIYIDWGAFITAIINFLIIALTLFIIIKTFNAYKKYFGEVTSLSKKENREIYKKLKAKAKEEKRKYKDVKAEYEAELVAQAKAEKEAKLAAEKLAHPGEEALLLEIRDLLKAQQLAKTEPVVDQTSETVVETTTKTKTTRTKKAK